MEYNITIRGQIGGWWGISPSDIKNYLDKHKEESIDVAICSPGGFVDDGIEIYQLFKDHGNVHAHIIGMTASAATIIAMGAKTVDMAKNSLILIHNASMFINAYESVNKERLDQLLKDYQKQRDDLKTIDDLIANIYADHCGKKIDEIKNKMTEGKWISSTEALNFGLIDEIREDEQADKVLNEIRSQYSNSIIKDFGLPSLPEEAKTENMPIADADGNPTESFLLKTLHALKGRFSNNSASNKSTNSMKKVFACICALLEVESLESKDDSVTIKVTDIQKVEDRLVKLEKDVTEANEAKKKALEDKSDIQKKLDEASTKLAEKETEIANLKKGAGAKVDETPENEVGSIDHEANRKLFNTINPD
jgi:ATP-dependent protease ClpP protease subunit